MPESFQSAGTTTVRSWACAALLLDQGIEPVGATIIGPVVVFEFPTAAATAVIARYGRLIARLNEVADAARAAKVMR